MAKTRKKDDEVTLEHLPEARLSRQSRLPWIPRSPRNTRSPRNPGHPGMPGSPGDMGVALATAYIPPQVFSNSSLYSLPDALNMEHSSRNFTGPIHKQVDEICSSLQK